MIGDDSMTGEFHATIDVQLLVEATLEEGGSTKVFTVKKVLQILNTHPVVMFNNSVDNKALLDAIGHYINNPQE